MDPLKIDGSSPDALKTQGNAALRRGELTLAARLYTLGIDLALAGSAVPTTAAEWFAADKAAGAADGVLHKLLSNRSLAHCRDGDVGAAIDDARACCAASPGFAKGHVRLLDALKSARAPMEEVHTAAQRGVLACPRDETLRLKAEAIAQAVAAVVAADSGGRASSAAATPSTKQSRASAGKQSASTAATKRSVRFGDDAVSSRMAETRRIAGDATDPRRAMAAADLGAALAVGAHGLAQDEREAERFLRIGEEGGDAVARRHLALLLLDQSRRIGRSGASSEAAALLRKGADAGDDEAKSILVALAAEAKQQAEHARFQLEALATKGDPRAIEMLAQLRREQAL